jgi:two-component system phosphate regulon response regulator PhoB
MVAVYAADGANMKVLIIEDDSDIAELVEYNLRQEKYAVEVAKNGMEGLAKVRRLLPDLIVLDLMLPDRDGLDICRDLKADPKTKATPILMLTAKGNEVDRVVGFEVGADDYLTKPFSPRELVLRVRAILKRIKEREVTAKTEPLSFGILRLDPGGFQVTVGSADVRLTAIEFKLLQHLLSNKGRVATRDMLLDQVWGYEAALTTRTVDTHIKRLREKLGGAGDYIETIRGIGYRFKEKDE